MYALSKQVYVQYLLFLVRNVGFCNLLCRVSVPIYASRWFFFVHFDSELLCTLCNSAFEQYDPRSCTKIVVWFRCVLLRFLLNMKFDANDSQMFTQISGLQFHCGSISFSVSISIWTKCQIHQQRCADHKNTKKKRKTG